MLRARPLLTHIGSRFNVVHMDKRCDNWSGDVIRKSDSLDLEDGVFTFDDPARIAKSLSRSAEESDRRKTTAFQSAMSMLTFYINRAGDHLEAGQKDILEQAKEELRKHYGKDS